MDVRDFSSVIALPEDDVSSALGTEAASLFQLRKFEECRVVLNQLLHRKGAHPKILHNIAIVENYVEGCVNPKKLLDVLRNVQAQSEELTRVSREQVAAVNGSGSNTTVEKLANNSMTHESTTANSSPIVLYSELGPYVALFNIAVTWFHLHEYSNSFSILEQLFEKMARITEGIALRVCFLLLDVALLSHHASRFDDVINYVERVFCIGTLICQGDDGSSTEQQSSTLVTESSVFNSTPFPDISSSDLTINSPGSPLSRSLSEEAEYENFFSALDISGQNLTRKSDKFSNNFPRNHNDDTFPVIDLKLKLHLYKVSFLLLTRKLKAAKREVKMAMNIARGKDYSMAVYLKSQLEYARGNHRESVKILMASSNRTELETSIMYHNNLGCIYHRLGKHQTSTVYFSKALKSSSLLWKEKPLTISTFSQDKSLLIVYNCGLQYLACGKPVLAVRCFYKASLVFYNHPLLWLRIAECCLMSLEKGLLESNQASSSRPDVNVHVIGLGKWRNLVIEDKIFSNGQVGLAGREELLSGYNRLPKLSMPLARQCLQNVLHLLNCNCKYGLPSEVIQEEQTSNPKNAHYISVYGRDSQTHNVGAGNGHLSSNGEMKEQKSVNNLNTTLKSSILYYDDICRKENKIIRQSVLADLAYVELELGNPLKALAIARTLLKIAESSRIHVFLGNVYAAEALCLLNQPKEAADNLLVYMSSRNHAELPYTQEDCTQWHTDNTVGCEESVNMESVVADTPSPDGSQGLVFLKPEEARGTIYANLAAVSAIQGDLVQADRFVFQALSAIPDSPGAILTAVYLDLMFRRPREAIAKLKRCSRTRFLPTGSGLKLK
ncbi:CCR4-NOT transcription complex subunit 10 [Heracleum sosnowskyi]|uniref:CCR4-NOT transcription complex subunit 10 n=1 Tax=Heracleum sosnowskyi TaxID=360622 RepID=A0AAD8J8U9_9APIA|nr:CCR4-NOT transcription complex subunit 10 [Heracleum sosnowskyi]